MSARNVSIVKRITFGLFIVYLRLRNYVRGFGDVLRFLFIPPVENKSTSKEQENWNQTQLNKEIWLRNGLRRLSFCCIQAYCGGRHRRGHWLDLRRGRTRWWKQRHDWRRHGIKGWNIVQGTVHDE